MEYSPYDEQLNVDPYPLYARLRETAPVYHNEDLDIWALSRHSDVDAALRDSAGFSSSNGPLLDSAIWGPDAHKVMSFNAMDPPEHTRTRALVSAVFNPRRMAGLEPRIRDIVRTHLEPVLERESFDFIADVAATVPMDVISELIGVPPGDRAEARRLINLAFHRPPGARDLTPENAQAMGALAEYYVRWVGERRRTPSTDLLTTLAEAPVDGSPLTDQQIIALLGLLVTAGYETSLRLLGSLDQVSGGRAILGIGAGWNREEMRDHGTDPRTRMALMRERVLAMKELWTSEQAEFHGKYVDFPPAYSWPKPLHPIPVLVGGWGRGTFDRVIEYGDGWFPYAGSPEALTAGIAELRERAGRRVRVVAHAAAPEPKVVADLTEAGVDEITFNLPSEPRDETLRHLDRMAELLG